MENNVELRIQNLMLGNFEDIPEPKFIFSKIILKLDYKWYVSLIFINLLNRVGNKT